MLPKLLPAFSFLVAGLVGCSSSSSDETKDAAPSPHDASDASPEKDSSTRDAAALDAHEAAPVDASDGGSLDAATDAPPVPVFTLEAGTTWSDLYRDYFGPTGVASCSASSQCHGTTSGDGYLNSDYLCPRGGTDASTACWASITSQGEAGADLLTPDASFASDYLDTTILCQDAGGGAIGGEMPYDCSYVFTAIDLQRIGDWVNAGALDN